MPVLSSPAGRPRWLRVFLLLATVNLATLIAGVMLGDRALRDYRTALDSSRALVDLRGAFMRVEELAARVDVPGNDIFVSHDPVLKGRRLDAALAAYRRQSALLRERLQQRGADEAPLVADLDASDRELGGAVTEARQVLALWPTDPIAAAARMAAMDRHFDRVGAVYHVANDRLAERQRQFFAQQFQLASALQEREQMIEAIALLVVLALLYYGWRASVRLEQRVRDRTRELERATEATRAGEERFRVAARSVQAMIWEWDLKTGLVWQSEAVAALTGEPPASDRLAEWWFARIHPDDAPSMRAAVDRAVRGSSSSYELEYRVRGPEGRWLEVNDRGFVIRDEAGEPLRVVGSVMDVSQMRHAARAQAEQQVFLRQVIDTIPNYVFVKDREGRFRLANRAVAEAYGTTPDAMLGRTDAELSNAPDEVEHFRRADLQAMDSLTELFVAEEPITTSTGERRWLQTVKRPIVNAEGRADQMLGISTDITARKEAKSALELVAATVESSDDAVSSVDTDGTILTWNAGAERLFGYTAAEAIGQPMALLRPRLDEAERDAFVTTIREGGRVRRLELEVLRKDDRPLTVAVTLSPLHDDGGVVRGASLIARDVTESRRAADRLRRSEASLAEAQRIARMGSWELDLLENRLYWSDETFRQLGFEPGSIEPTFEAFMGRVHPEDRAIVGAAMETYGGSREPFEYGLRYVSDDGTARAFHIRARYDYNEQGVATRLSGTSLDVTQQREAEAELRRAREEAEAANRAKSDFLANMSHEIRTPMNGVLGMLELALDSTLTPEQRDYLRTAHASADALLEIINDILDFSKIESGRFELDPVAFQLGESLGDMMGTLALRAHEKQVELAMEIAPDVHDALTGDVGRLRQVLVNLVGNAIKFTARGEVVLRITNVESHETASVLRFSVSDTGIGIAPDKQRVIFEAFQQADSSTTREYGGTGLGLAISSRLVHLMGGEIDVESVQGVGSTFSFTARFEHATDEEGQVPRLAEVDLAGVPILVVDDNATNLRIVEQMVTRWGMRPTTATGGREALEAAQRASASGEPFPLVLTDADMPGMDGFALVSEMRAQPALRAASVLMLSSARHNEELARCRELDVTQYLTKPVSGPRLREAVRRALGGVDTPVAGRPAAAAAPLRRLRVLVAEDNPVNQKLVRGVLERAAHEVEIVETGQAAVDRTAEARFDVALMDVQMPGMGGLEATRLIREREAGNGFRLPIIALTARAMKGDREACLAAGMDGYLSKPLRASELMAALAAHTRYAEPVREWSPPVPDAVADDELDAPALLELVGHDRSLLAELVALFQADTPERLTAIRDALAAGDADGVRFAAHTLKGSAASLSAHRVAALASDLESHGLRGDLAPMGALVDPLEGAVRRAVERLLSLVERS